MTRIAITRAEPEASATAARVISLGGEPILAPLLEIKPVAFDARTENVQALLFTSANGVKSFAAATSEREVHVFCVGEATALTAERLGFTQVSNSAGDLRALATLAAAQLAPDAGLVLHISGRDVAGDIIGALQQRGFSAERRVAYAAEIVPALPATLQNPCDFILFHSARAADAFVGLGAPHASGMAAACLSEQVANAARQAPFKHIIVAPYPRERALLHAVLPPPGAIA